jgi:hypothetical protein
MAKKERVFKKVESSLFKFENPGDTVEGELISIEDSQTYDNKNYKIKKDDGSVILLFGTTVLDSQMQSVPVTSYVKITFTGTKENKNGQTMRLFDVFVA